MLISKNLSCLLSSIGAKKSPFSHVLILNLQMDKHCELKSSFATKILDRSKLQKKTFLQVHNKALRHFFMAIFVRLVTRQMNQFDFNIFTLKGFFLFCSVSVSLNLDILFEGE